MRDALLDRYRGCLLGLACGDALGTTVEFQRRGSFEPLVDMVGGGPFELDPGQWTDDTSMALCLAESLRYRDGFDARDQMSRYCNWWQHGYLSATGRCFDIGTTVRASLSKFLETGEPMAGSTSPDTAGNGSLMRLAPIVLFRHPDRAAILHEAAESSRTTHAAPEAIECCVLFSHLLAEALDGKPKEALVLARGLPLTQPRVVEIASGGYLDKPRSEIAGTGYCVASLEAALWCFQHNDDYPSTVLAAANLGDDADTTAAIAGQIAGAHYGLASIPAAWLEKLAMRAEIEAYANDFHARNRSD